MVRNAVNEVVRERIDALRMCESEKQIAAEYVRDGQRLGELVCLAGAGLRSALELVNSAIPHRG